MKHQILSLKNNDKIFMNVVWSSAAVVIGALRVKSLSPLKREVKLNMAGLLLLKAYLFALYYRKATGLELTLKVPNKNCSRRHFIFLLLSFKGNKA